ncbi:MAG TPA: phosphotransferase [Mycobacteriales bacterium]|nr:phosphotransferase [Mycobacteriales bacterium]
MLGRAEHGTLGGAVFVQWPDGRPGVVTRFIGTLFEAQRTANVLELARRRDLPVPRHELVMEVEEAVIVVQERLPGSPPAQVTPAVVDAMVELNDRFAGALADHPGVPLLPLCLDGTGDRYPRHETLAAYSDRGRRILDAIRRIDAEAPGEMAGSDLLHIDLTGPNVLFDDAGAVTGIVDWNLGAYRGDRHLALVKTRFEEEWGIHSQPENPNAVASAAYLDQILAERVPPVTLRRYWAHRILYQLYWAINELPPEVLDWHFEVAESRLL